MKIRNVIGAVGLGLCALSWLALIVGLIMGVDIKVRAVLAIIAALSTEALFWCLALIMGLTVFEARRKIWRWLTRRKGGEAAR